MNQADSMASSVGVMHALRTGNPIVDMLIAMSVEDVDAASKVVQRRDGLTGGGAAR